MSIREEDKKVSERRTSSASSSASDFESDLATADDSTVEIAEAGAGVRSRAGVTREAVSGGGEARRAAAADLGEGGARDGARESAGTEGTRKWAVGGGDGERSLGGGTSGSGDLRASVTVVFVWDMVGGGRGMDRGGREERWAS